MTETELQTIYETLAQAIDDAGSEREIFLAKLALALADELGSAERVLRVVDECEQGLRRRDR